MEEISKLDDAILRDSLQQVTVVIELASKLGGREDQSIHQFVTDVLQEEPTLALWKSLSLCHLKSIFKVLQRALELDPLSSVPIKYKEPLPEIQKQQLLLNHSKLPNRVLAKTLKNLLLQLTQPDPPPPGGSILDWLPYTEPIASDDVSSTAVDDHFPEGFCLSHSFELYQLFITQ